MGYKSIIADSLWLRILPDIDTQIPRAPHKRHTWQYEMIDTITDLAPTFRAAYRNGGEILGIVLDDKEGAKRIFEKGMRHFPDYWPLQYSAAYLYMEEMKNPQRAAELLLLAHKNGGPDWFVSLAGKLFSDAGQKELAVKSLLDYLQRFPTGESRVKVIERLKSLGVDPSLYIRQTDESEGISL